MTVGFLFFPSMIFCGEAAKKTSIDGLKWRDLVMGWWWLVNFKVSAVRCPVSQRVLCVKLRKPAVATLTSTCTRTANTSAKLFNFEITVVA